MRTEPLISIIMAAYNAEATIAEAIESVLMQTYQQWELIIVDDGGTDNSYDISISFGDDRIQVIRQANEGVSIARNFGLRQMSGDYFCFLDADDTLPCQSLSARLKKFESSLEIAFVDGKIQVMDSTLTQVLEVREQTYFGNPFAALLKIDNSCFFGPTWMVRRDPNFNYEFKPGLTHGEDLLFYMMISQRGGVYAAVDEVIYNYRSGNQSAMSDLDGLWKGYQSIFRELKSRYDLSELQLGVFKRKITSIMFKSYLGHGKPLRAVKVLFDQLLL